MDRTLALARIESFIALIDDYGETWIGLRFPEAEAPLGRRSHSEQTIHRLGDQLLDRLSVTQAIASAMGHHGLSARLVERREASPHPWSEARKAALELRGALRHHDELRAILHGDAKMPG